MSLIETRLGGNATTLPGAVPFGALSRRSALFGAVTIAGFGASFAHPAAAVPTISGAVSPISADANLIELAGRVEALARRCSDGAARRRVLQNRIHAAWPWPEDPPYPTRSTSSIKETAGGQVMTISIPKTPNPALIEWTQARDDARNARNRGQKAMEDRVGLTRAYRQGGRMRRRLERWSDILTATEPATTKGLAAKASAVLALSQGSNDLEDRSEIIGAVLRDAMRLGTGVAA